MKNILILVFILLISINAYCQEKTILTNVEGFYSQGWEHSNFMQLDFENCFLIADHWTVFTPGLKYKGKLINFDEIANLEGVYMRINAVQKSGSSLGHLGAWNSEIIVTEILEIDSNRNLKQCLKEYGPIKRKPNKS